MPSISGFAPKCYLVTESNGQHLIYEIRADIHRIEMGHHDAAPRITIEGHLGSTATISERALIGCDVEERLRRIEAALHCKNPVREPILRPISAQSIRDTYNALDDRY